jgi:hypothetical protein
MILPRVTYLAGWSDRIPVELKRRRQWVVWRYEWRQDKTGNGKWTKVPYQVRKTRGRYLKAKANCPETWGTFDEALCVYQANADKSDNERFDGIGYEFAMDDEYVGVDFDDCLTADGELRGWAVAWLELLGPTYADVSPSGTRIKAFYRGKLPARPDGKTGRRRAGYGPDGSGEIEAYDHGRYFTLTGRIWWEDHPTIAEAAPGALDSLAAELDAGRKGSRKGANSMGPRSRKPEEAAPLPRVDPDLKAILDQYSDEELLKWARHAKNGAKFSRLYDEGYCSEYPSGSEADCALLVRLAFWTGEDADRMERLFGGSALSRREKWTRPDYRARSIASAIAMNAGNAPDLSERTSNGFIFTAGRKAPPLQPRYWPAMNGKPHEGPKAKSIDALSDNDVGSASVAGGDEIEAQGPDSRPCIIIKTSAPGDSLGKWTDQVVDAIRQTNDPPYLFQHGGQLVRLRRADAEAPYSIEPLSPDALRGILDRCAYFREPRVSKKGEPYMKWGPPRMEIVKDFAALTEWDPETIPYLESVVASPFFLKDGRLIMTPGYHPEARVFYQPSPELEGLTISEKPSRSEIDSAKALIYDDLFVDFPFTDEASRANALACMLVPFVRNMIEGPTPLHHSHASTEGTGKGLLAKVCADPSLGRDLQSSPQKENDAEWRKAITSSLISGPSHIFYDNLYMPVRSTRDGDYPVPIDSAALASVLTEDEWRDRILGGNTEARIKIRCIFMSSGNNVEWSRELARRIVPITLSPPSERPWERPREDYKHPDLRQWARQNRPRLVHACLTLCQARVASGCPDGRQSLGSYEAYTRVMGGILDVAEVRGFLANKVKPAENDRESQRWSPFVNSWHDAFGQGPVSAAQLWEMIAKDEELHQAFADTLGEKNALSQKQRLGLALKAQEDRVWGQYRIVRCGSNTDAKCALYRLMPSNVTTG